MFSRSGAIWTQGAKLTGGPLGSGFGWSVALSADGKTALIGGPGDSGVGAAWVFVRSGSSWTQQGAKLKGSGETAGGGFGFSVALSVDGKTALIGGPGGDSGVGAAWVFVRSGSSWTQQGAKLTGSGQTDPFGSGFGSSVALSADGKTALIGGPGDNNSVGAAWVFVRSESSWTQEGAKLTSKSEPEISPGVIVLPFFGVSVALSADGKTALIGGLYASTIPGGFQAGAAWVFVRSGSTWTQQGARLTPSDESGPGVFGFSVALSADGNTALIGGPRDDNSLGRRLGIGGVGAAWVFSRSGSTWTQQGAKLTRDEIGGGQFQFGSSVALSADAKTALIGGPGDFSLIGGDSSKGAALVFTPMTVPGAPTAVSATGGDGRATVRFTSPDANSSPISSYTVTSSPGGKSATGPVSPLTVTGLRNGTSYTFTVTATSAAGTGPASEASKAVTPAEATTATVALIGDLNGDGLVDCRDLAILKSHFGEQTSVGDLNGDGVVNVLDLSILLTHWTGPRTDCG